MSLAYNVKFSKVAPSGKVILAKEGEVLVYEKGLRLRGKGAHDKGELVHFSDVRGLRVDHEHDVLHIDTYFRDGFMIADAGSMFKTMVTDLYRVRNEFLIDNLFMRQGTKICEHSVYIERVDVSGTVLTKGKALLRLFSDSIIAVPFEDMVFGTSFSFVASYEFDHDEYLFTMTLDDGTTLRATQFGNEYDIFEEHFQHAMRIMYESLMDQLDYFFIGFPRDKLVKLAHLMRYGRLVRLKDIQKIDKDLAKKMINAVFKDEMFLQTVAAIHRSCDEEHTFVGLRISDGKKEVYTFTVAFAIPDQNMLVCTFGSYDKEIRKVQDTYFFRLPPAPGPGLIMESILAMVRALNETGVTLHSVPDPIFKDAHELRQSIYKLAIRQLPFLQLLRGTFLGRCPSILPELFQRNFDRAVQRAGIASGVASGDTARVE